MIVVDANLLIYSYDLDSAHHKKSLSWLEELLSGVEAVGLPWPSVSAFLRVITNRRLPGTRVTLEQAVQVVDEWLQQPNVQVLVPADQHWSVLRQMILEGRASGPLVSDAEIAAITIEQGAVLHTTDRDFARFPGLRWKNPLS
ncbi:Ribonuclease VapC [Candidatus Sulfotelmatobacter sp. SbA7]|nr:Ribonuclease VapC [Candidatus Sulfotelmatobacter sp. SbA7]